MTNELQRRFGAPRSIRFLLCASALCMSIAISCKHERIANDVDPVGTYTLMTVDGKPLPCKVAHEGSPTVKSGVFHIDADGSCSSEILFSVASGADTVRAVKARFTREGNRLTMKWEGAGTTTGRVDGDAFTMDNEGIVFAYRK